jgi:hypothetical protein
MVGLNDYERENKKQAVTTNAKIIQNPANCTPYLAFL